MNICAEPFSDVLALCYLGCLGGFPCRRHLRTSWCCFAASCTKCMLCIFYTIGHVLEVSVFICLKLLQVVEIVDRYDDACVPANMTDNKLAYIQNPNISKECTRTLTVMSLISGSYLILND